MFDRLESVLTRYFELNELLSSPEVVNDRELYQRYSKEHSEKAPVALLYAKYKEIENIIIEARQILDDGSADDELRELAGLDVEEGETKLTELSDELKVLLIPADEYDDKNIYLEIRAGTGGDEASLFVADLFKMYSRYAELSRWSIELMELNESGVGGIKEVVALIKGRGVYSRLKFEAGTHRVQRIPETEASGRVHTSACTVAVLPEADDIDVGVDAKDLKVDTYRASGAGGQHVNTTDSAVRITHNPTGLVVTCQDERSQIKNREKAMKLLKARLLEVTLRKQQEDLSASRRLQVGSGDRSERIRTYNFPQNRLTDHRVNLTLYSLDKVMEGELNDVIDTLIAEDRADKLKR